MAAAHRVPEPDNLDARVAAPIDHFDVLLRLAEVRLEARAHVPGPGTIGREGHVDAQLVASWQKGQSSDDWIRGGKGDRLIRRVEHLDDDPLDRHILRVAGDAEGDAKLRALTRKEHPFDGQLLRIALRRRGRLRAPKRETDSGEEQPHGTHGAPDDSVKPVGLLRLGIEIAGRQTCTA